MAAKKGIGAAAPKKRRARATFTYEGRRYEATGADRREAERNAALMEDRLRRGEIGVSSGMTVRRWADEWLEAYKRQAVTEKVYRDYKSQVDNHIAPAIGSFRLSEVRALHLQKILNGRAGLSLSRVKMLHITIRAMFKKARQSGLVSADPSEHLEMPRAHLGTRRSITDFEREHFLKAAREHHAGLMFKAMLYCGLRGGEAAALSWGDVDLPARLIRVRRTMESGSGEMKEPKTPAGIRDVPIPDAIWGELLEASEGSASFEPVFTQRTTGRRHTESSRAKAWASLKKQIDISMGARFEKRAAADGKMREQKVLSVVAADFVPHCLRHTYCTDLQNAGVPINVAKYLMGHSLLEVTARIYTHMGAEALESAAQRINRAV